MIQKLTKQIAFLVAIVFPISMFAQTTLTYAAGAWTPYAPSATTSIDNAIVNDVNCRTVNGAVVNNLTINANMSMNQGVRSLTVNGDLTMLASSSIVFSSGTLTVLGNTSVSITGNSSDTRYNVWSSPFSGSIGTLTTFSGSNPCDIYVFQASTQNWVYDYSMPFTTSCDGSAVTFTSANGLNGVDGTSDGNFDIGRGYFAPGNASPTRVFSSTSALNNGTINVPVYGSSISVAGGNDWNLIGNPYPSSVRIGDVLTTNSALINAVYIYNGNTGGYLTFGTGSSSRIPAGQGFFVEATSAIDGFLGNLQFINSHRRTANTTLYKTEGEPDPTKAFISLSSNTVSDQIQVLFHDDCLDGFDTKYDARKLMNDHGLNLASLIELDPSIGMEPFVFNGLKTITNNNTKTINLLVHTPQAGTFEFNLDSTLLLNNDIMIKLEDKSTNTFTDLKAESYSFNTQSADSLTNRFFLHFTNTVTSVSELTNSIIASIYSDQENINITILGNEKIKEVNIYDVTGRKTFSNLGNSNTMKVDLSIFNQGFYIVKVTTINGKIATKRIFIK